MVTDSSDYAAVLAEMATHDGATTLVLRRKLAGLAFARTAAYDAEVSAWFAELEGEQFPPVVTVAGTLKEKLRYGENPHQAAAVYLNTAKRPGIATATQLQGKELSFNNLNDTDAAYECVAEFEPPAVAVIKHANPCGVATGSDLRDAYQKALACDPVSAFGGIIAVNRPLDAATVEAIGKLFVEVIIAPEVTDEAKALLAKKQNLRLDIDIKRCPNCGGALKIIAAIEDPSVIVKILRHLGLPTRAPPRAPARANASHEEPFASVPTAALPKLTWASLGF